MPKQIEHVFRARMITAEGSDFLLVGDLKFGTRLQKGRLPL